MSPTKDSFPVVCRLCASAPMYVASGLLFCTPLCPLADLTHSVERWNDLNSAIDEKFAALTDRIEELEEGLVCSSCGALDGKDPVIAPIVNVPAHTVERIKRLRREWGYGYECDPGGLNPWDKYCRSCGGGADNIAELRCDRPGCPGTFRAPAPATNMDGLEGRRLDIVGLDPDRPGDIYAPAPTKEGGSDE